MTAVPLIVVTLMIKNESASIQATLTSYYEGGLRHFFIFDTGSTDDTLALTQAFFQQYPSTVHIQQEPFIDFAQSRNRALDLAERVFPDAVFFVMPDAEWHLQHGDALLAFCKKEQHQQIPLYLMTINMNATVFTTARLLRAHSNIRFQGVVHEVPNIVANIKVPDPVCFQVVSTSPGICKSKQRWEQDLKLLFQELKRHPEDARTAFYLAQTYECLERYDEAYRAYQHRATLLGWDEENFITLFRLGCLTDRLTQQTHSLYTWDMAMEYFLKAFALRPHRIEPLVKMADHYWPENAQASYLYIKHAYDLPYPEQDLLFVEKGMYDYDRYEIMSRCAWYVKQYELGKEATLRALAVAPDMPHLRRNLELYQEQLL